MKGQWVEIEFDCLPLRSVTRQDVPIDASPKYADRGEIAFEFEGTALTGEEDRKTRAVDLQVSLLRETCGWLSQPIVDFFAESVQHAVLYEFDRYIEAGDLTKTEERMQRLEEQNEISKGFVGMYL